MDLKTQFDFIYEFTNAIVYSKEEIDSDEFSDETEEIEYDELISTNLQEGTRVGVLNCEENDIECLIVFKRDSEFFSNNGNMTNDGISYFKLEENIHFVPAQEPVDVINDLAELYERVKLEALCMDLKLNHLLLTN